MLLPLVALLTAAPAWGIVPSLSYPQVIQRVVAMPQDAILQQRASGLGLNVLNVMWEDTGRSEGSALGPNISDLTLQVRAGNSSYLLPVIRFPNYEDKTGDVRADKLWVRVGNQKKDGALTALPLSEVLKHLRRHLSDPTSLKGDDDFSAPRDTHFLVSAQHVFVPIPQGGKAEFNPVLFNYQSAPGSPAVLTLLITREGMSATIIEGESQPLYFNHGGQQTRFTAERKSDVSARIDAGEAKASDAGALEEGADMMMIVQVPLKHQNRGYLSGLGAAAESMGDALMMAKPASKAPSRAMDRDDIEQAVLGHGDAIGPFAEMANLKLERDRTFPVRVTVQFYRATSNGVVSEQSLADVKTLIDRVYKDADYVGSLVVPNGDRPRPTSWIQKLKLSLAR